MFESLSKYHSIVLDYSVVFEYSKFACFGELVSLFGSNDIECYVDDTFKVLHYCVVAQNDPKDAHVHTAVRTLMRPLLENKKIHLVNTCNTERFIEQIRDINDSCILTTTKSIFAKRLREKLPKYEHDVVLVTPDGLVTYSSVAEMAESNPFPEVSKLAQINTFLESDSSANVGDIVTTSDGLKFNLVKRLSGGAEGMVFFTDNPKFVAKIYHKGVITPLRWAKLKKLVELGITADGFCAPQHLLFFRNQPVGYTMPIGKGTTLSDVFDGPDAMIERFPDWTRLDICQTLLSLIGQYLYLHMHNVVAGDIQLKNALIYTSTSHYLIDMDSVQIGNLPCPVGTEEFTDPKLWGKDFSGFVRTLQDEDYSIAMLVFSVLFCGLHPYATRRGAETLREEIMNRNFPYTLDNSDTEHIPVGGYVHIWESLPEHLRVMLYKTFKEGYVYEAVCWRDAIQKYMNELENCVYDNSEYYKLFPYENYPQVTINVDEIRSMIRAQKDIRSENAISEQLRTASGANHADEASQPVVVQRPKFEKKTFANAPTGRYVSPSVSDDIRPLSFNQQSKSSSAQGASGKESSEPRKKKFLGLF